jgi:hypothetical protein
MFARYKEYMTGKVYYYEDRVEIGGMVGDNDARYIRPFFAVAPVSPHKL